jgi:hypothetical protein
MIFLIRSLFICLSLCFSSPVLAEREVHVVAIGKGYRTENVYASPVAHVVVDRPGHDVSLVLLDGGEIHWRVEATDGTIINEVIRNRPSSKESKVSLFGIPMIGEQAHELPVVFHPWGPDFRTLVEILTDKFGTDRIHSFQGAHQVYAGSVRVDHVDMATPELTPDYLFQQLDAFDDLPLDIQNWVESGARDNEFSVTFDGGGINLTGPNATRRFTPTPNVPGILLPVMGVYDPGSQIIYCITYGAEGYIYSVDVQTKEWSVVTSLNEYDAAGLLYDPRSRVLITTGAFSRPGEIKVFGLDGNRSSSFVPTTDFPGLIDLFDFGNEDGPPLTPLVFSGGWLLLEALADSNSAYPGRGECRIYAVQIATNQVRLLRFRND